MTICINMLSPGQMVLYFLSESHLFSTSEFQSYLSYLQFEILIWLFEFHFSKSNSEVQTDEASREFVVQILQ